MTTHKLVPVELTPEMKQATALKIPAGHGQAWVYAGDALAAGIDAAPNQGRVSREKAEAVADAIRDPMKYVGPKLLGEWPSRWGARAVIAALGLETEGE
jgi:hypothetical protein